MAALAAVCEATARQPECTQDALDAGATDSFLASLPRGQTLQKPRPGALSRCVPAGVCARPGASSRCVPARVRARPGVPSRCVPARVRACPGAQTGAPAGRLAAVSRVTAGQPGTFSVFCESFKVRESTCSRAAGTWRPRGAVRLVAGTRSVAAARPGGGGGRRAETVTDSGAAVALALVPVFLKSRLPKAGARSSLSTSTTSGPAWHSCWRSTAPASPPRTPRCLPCGTRGAPCGPRWTPSACCPPSRRLLCCAA